MAEHRKANILFAIADDASHFGCYGHRFVSTPCIDNLASRGVRFTSAFTTNPKCAPSRASILTGHHTWQLKEGCDHYGYFPDNFEVYPDVLEDAGYLAGFTGKGWAPGDYTRCGRHQNPAGKEYNSRRLTPPASSEISSCDYAANFSDFMKDRKKDQPFCFWYGCHEPHRPYAFGESEGEPAVSDKTDDPKPPPYWPDEDLIRQDMRDYAYEINWFDRQLEGIVSILKEEGELDNTWIIVTSDNGAPFPRVKGQMYDDDFRLPLIVHPPGGISGRTCEELVSFTDFFPAFLEIAGLPGVTDLPGQSLLSLCGSEDQPSWNRSYVLMGRERHDLGRENDTGYPVRCLRTKDELFVWNLKPERWPAGNPETGFTNCDSSP
ncbi:MAG: sulfatase, partial [Spirochaetales bacterium]|nr:sulfatase [Spirochaetales bacterium]